MAIKGYITDSSRNRLLNKIKELAKVPVLQDVNGDPFSEDNIVGPSLVWLHGGGSSNYFYTTNEISSDNPLIFAVPKGKGISFLALSKDDADYTPQLVFELEGGGNVLSNDTVLFYRRIQINFPYRHSAI